MRWGIWLREKISYNIFNRYQHTASFIYFNNPTNLFSNNCFWTCRHFRSYISHSTVPWERSCCLNSSVRMYPQCVCLLECFGVLAWCPTIDSTNLSNHSKPADKLTSARHWPSLCGTDSSGSNSNSSRGSLDRLTGLLNRFTNSKRATCLYMVDLLRATVESGESSCG